MNTLTKTAQELRKNMTRAERHLWYDFLRQLPVIFHKKKIIEDYIVDFYCASKKLIIEVDKAVDAERDAYFSSFGLTVIYFSSNDIFQNFEETCEKISAQLGTVPN